MRDKKTYEAFAFSFSNLFIYGRMKRYKPKARKEIVLICFGQLVISILIPISNFVDKFIQWFALSLINESVNNCIRLKLKQNKTK